MFPKKILDADTVLINAGKTLDNTNACELARVIDEAREGGHKFIIVRMAELEMLSSTGVGAILSSVQALRDIGGDIILCDPSDKITRIFKVLDLLEYVNIMSNEDVSKQFRCEAVR